MSYLFNRSIAEGQAFCNRVLEIKQLAENIEGLTHTLLISPRRYGKTSLALKAIQEANLPYAHMDLFMKFDKNDVIDEFTSAIGSLMAQCITPSKKALQSMQHFFKNIKVSLSLGKLGFQFGFEPIAKGAHQQLKELLNSVDEVLQENNKRAIIFIDEIQTISDTTIGDELEAALRFVAQKTKQICFIFSGSQRHLLSRIFEDNSRPFYKLCEKMVVERIAAKHYQPFLAQHARAKWGKPLSEQVLLKIFDYTQCHTYYVNVLCHKLFRMQQLPSVEYVDEAWHQCCVEEQSACIKEVERLTRAQKQVLSQVKKNPGLVAPTSKAFVQSTSLSVGGVSKALESLIQYDIVEKLSTGEIRIVDPVIAYWV